MAHVALLFHVLEMPVETVVAAHIADMNVEVAPALCAIRGHETAGLAVRIAVRAG